jgi:nitroreductase
MEAMKAILTRRSIRKYTRAPITQKMREKLLRAAMSAPSAGNEQPWHFVVVDDHKVLDEIPRYHAYSQMLREAPLAMVVCGDLLLQKVEGQWWVQDCSAATQNLLIAAHAMGLGAVWLGVYPREERVDGIRKLLGLPENVMPLSIISIGYPAETKAPGDRYEPSRVHHNKW